MLILGISILFITTLNYVLISISSLSRRAKSIGRENRLKTSPEAVPTAITIVRISRIAGVSSPDVPTGRRTTCCARSPSSAINSPESLSLIHIFVAGMMSIDMGGPFNKAAYVFGTAALASGNYGVMAAVMVGGMVPPIAIAPVSYTHLRWRWTFPRGG